MSISLFVRPNPKSISASQYKGTPKTSKAQGQEKHGQGSTSVQSKGHKLLTYAKLVKYSFGI